MRYIGLWIIINLFIVSCSVKFKDIRVVGEIDLTKIFDGKVNVKNLDQYVSAYYSHNMLFIADNLNKKILGIDYTGGISFVLGRTNKQDTRFNQVDLELVQQVQDFSKILNLNPQKMDKIFYPRDKKQHFSVNEYYNFHNIIDFVVDLEGNFYILDQVEQAGELTPAQYFILKFSPKGNFLYRIGKMGRDNLPFQGKLTFEKMMIRPQGELWVKYQDEDGQNIRGYNHFGKNIFLFESHKAQIALEKILRKEKIDHYLIEGVFVKENGNSVDVIVNLIDIKQSRVFEKRVYEFSKKYSFLRKVIFDNVDFQIFGIDWNSNYIGFGKSDQPNTFFLKHYSLKGKYLEGKNLMLEDFFYHHLNFRILRDDSILGSFIRGDELVFVLWE